MKNTILTLKIQAIVLLGIMLFACSDDNWDKHYNADPDVVSDKNLWTTIAETPELSVFAALLQEYGYDELLSQSQAYTVFAPDNEALATLDVSNLDVKTELIENHIARFMIPVSTGSVSSVYTLNGKKIKLDLQAGNYSFGTAPFALPATGIVASNGIVHILSGYDRFFPNIWEYLAQRSDLDSIRQYLYAFDQVVFNEAASTPGSIVDGQMTYLDSVFINYNTMLMRLGYINREDSSYTMIAPNNTAWNEAYNRIKTDFMYYHPTQAVADSLQQVYTKEALVQDLFFNNNIQEAPQDSLTSTSRNTFYQPQYLFAGTESITTSNGVIYIANELKYKPYESWHTTIKVEAERSLGRENTLSTAYTKRSEGEMQVSADRFLQLTPTTSSGNPTVTFEIPSTLSSAYNIYCVFVPGTVNNPAATGLKPCKFYFQLSYQDTDGTTKTDRFPDSGTIESNPYVMDSVLVVANFKFPTANYGEELTTVKLKLLSNVARTETANFSRELWLDCILLEPKKE
ncbi:MAG: fasciclin domain-containing protein [Candidatus Symbiothrix sp.]|nr:fasciclin domain-containing protein [Candidatus Symbiothrix sp.]